jgi:phosphoglycerate dehydrogenase-like enzyme
MNLPVEVLITLPFDEEFISQLSSVSPRLQITLHRARQPEEIPPEIWAQTEVLYTDRVIPSYEQAPNLRWIQFHWAGVNHMIDSPLLKKPGVVATTLSGAASPQMAEYAVMMLLALGHRLPDLFDNQKLAEWPRDRFERFMPQELRGSIVGIVGYGSIGRQIARLLREFGVTVLAAKRDLMNLEDTGYLIEGMGDPEGDFAHRLYPPQALRSMFKECDFVVVTVPLTDETSGLIGPEELAALKPTAYVVDFSRGGVVDSTALFEALRDHKIAGAALDVFSQEPLPADHPLWKLPNVILTPHVAGNTPYYNQRAVELFSENLHRYLAGLPLYNRINLERGY